MKIGIDGRFYRKSTGGIGRYTRALLNELGKIDTSNEYVVFLTSEDMKEYVSPGKNFRPVEVEIGHYSLAEQRKLPKILEDYQLDLIHYTNFNHPIFSKTPFVVTIHDLIMSLYPVGRKQKSWLRKFAYNWEMKDAARKAQRVIVPSEASKSDVVNMLGARADRVTVTYESVDEEYLAPVGVEKIAEIKRKYGIRKPYILFVSQWRPHKGIIELVQAYELLREQYNDDVELVLGGKPNEDFPGIKAAVDEIQEKLGGVNVTGFVAEEDLPGLYAGAEVFALPSLYEGFGITVLEAMAAGTAVAASKTSCLPEVGGEAAEYFDPKDPHDIARVLDEILNDKDKRERMIAEGHSQVKKFSWQKMAEETLKVYEEVLKK